jgi:hypothetical protein
VAEKFKVKVMKVVSIEVEVEADSHAEALDVGLENAQRGEYNFENFTELDWGVDYVFADLAYL